MTALIDDAIMALHQMPRDMQVAAARAILEFSAGDDETAD